MARVALGIDQVIMSLCLIYCFPFNSKAFPSPPLSSPSDLRNVMICSQEKAHKDIPGRLTSLRMPQLNAGLRRRIHPYLRVV